MVAGEVHGGLQECAAEAGAAGVGADPELLEAGVGPGVVQREPVAELREAGGWVPRAEQHGDFTAGQLRACERAHLGRGRLRLVELRVEVVQHPSKQLGVAGPADAEVVPGHGVGEGATLGSMVASGDGVSLGGVGSLGDSGGSLGVD